MEPAIECLTKTKFSNINEWALNVDDVICSNPATIGLPARAELPQLKQIQQELLVILMIK